MRRYSILKGIQKETKLLLCLLFCKSKHIKHLTLDIALMDTDTSASKLHTVQYDIVCLCTYGTRIAVKFVQIFFHHHRERMMHCYKSLFVLAPLKQREFCNPEEFIIIFLKQS